MSILVQVKKMMRSSKATTYAIDTGSCTTVVYKGKKKLFSEPTCIALHKKTRTVVAVGAPANQLFGKNPDSIEVLFPVQEGLVSDPEAYQLFLQRIVNQSVQDPYWKRVLYSHPFCLALPNCISPVNKQLYLDSTQRVLGAHFSGIDTGFALVKYYQALGYQPPVTCVIDIGGDSTYVGIFHNEKQLAAHQFKWGGIQITQAVQDFIREEYGCKVGWSQAEELKQSFSVSEISHKKKKAQKSHTFMGKDLVTNVLKSVEVKEAEIIEIISPYVEMLARNLEIFFAELPTETVTGVLAEGVCLSGGGSKLINLDEIVASALNTTIRFAKEPEEAVVQGISHIFAK